MGPIVQDVPETSSDERMHILDADCWCEPHIDLASDGFGALLRHRKP